MTMTFARIAVCAALAGLTAAACSDRQPEVASEQAQLSPALAFRDEDPSITITSPANGDVVTSPLLVEVSAGGMTLAPAGSTSDGYGHWHLLIDRGCQGPGQQIPEAADSLHVGTGADNLLVELEPGRYELCAQIGDGFHVAVDITHTIVIDVVE